MMAEDKWDQFVEQTTDKWDQYQDKGTPSVATTPSPKAGSNDRIKTLSNESEFPLNLPSKRTVLQMTGMGVGGATGAMAGPGGAAFGAAGGYALGNKAADVLTNDPNTPNTFLGQMGQMGHDMTVGLLYELVGQGAQIAGRAVGSATDFIKAITDAGGIRAALDQAIASVSKKQAAHVIASATTKTPIAVTEQIEKNTTASEGIEKSIPGLKFNIGQKGGDPNLISLARQTGQMPGAGSALSNESAMAQNEALRKYMQEKIRGGGNVDEFIDSIKTEQEALSATKAKVEEKVAGSQTGEVDVGQYLRTKAAKTKQDLSDTATKLYDDVPNDLKINTQPLWDKVQKVFGSFDAFTQRLSATPTGPMSRIQEALTPADGSTGALLPPETLTMKQIKDFRSQMTTGQRSAISQGDYELAYNFGQMKEGISETLDLAVKNGQGAEINKLKKATDFWRDVYVPTIRQGTTGKILARDKTGAYRVLDSSVGGEYFKAGTSANEAADAFLRTFGSNKEARDMIKDYAAQSLLKSSRNPMTGEIDPNRVAAWSKSHATALDKFGLTAPVKDLQKAAMEEATFNKSAITKALNANPDQAIAAVLQSGGGSRQTITRFQEMVRVARKGGPGAVDGLKAGIGDFMQGQIEVTAQDLAENRIASFAKIDKYMRNMKPALRESGLYNPQELQAFDNVHSALGIIAKQSRPHPQFSGSPTFELLSRLAASGTSVAAGHIGLYGAARGVIDMMERPIKNQINEAVARATFDPTYAAAISGLAADLKKTSVQIAEERFTRRLLSISAVGANQ